MNYTPETPNNYIGKQVIINSDRLIFNAKDDSILLFSDKALGFSTNGNLHFDTLNNGTNKFVINAPNIYLVLRYNDTYANEPVLLGNRTEAWLNDLIDVISYILDDVKCRLGKGKFNLLGRGYSIILENLSYGLGKLFPNTTYEELYT